MLLLIDGSVKIFFNHHAIKKVRDLPKAGIEPLRRNALVEATITEIGRAGSLDVTVSQIAKRAGVSSALAHHYFGSKDRIFLAAMRHILTIFGAEVRGALTMAHNPRQRVEAIIRASFSCGNFRPEVVSAWLNFYVQAQTSEEAHRLLRIYRKRLKSNLIHQLRSLAGYRSAVIAHGVAVMIDGLYIHQALRDERLNAEASVQMVMGYLDLSLAVKGES